MNLLALSKYLRTSHAIPGWLEDDVVGAIFVPLHALQAANNVSGNVAESVVGCGKSFIPLAAGIRSGERALAIGLPGPLTAAADQTARAARELFLEHVRSCLGPSLGGVTMPGDGQVADEDYLRNFGHFRIFHITGQYAYEAVRHAFSTAVASMAPGGVIVVDGYGSPITSRVRPAIDKFCAANPYISRLAAFSNKAVFVAERYARLYRDWFDNYVAGDVR